MVIYEMLISIIILWFIVLAIKKDIFSPSSLLCLSYIFAIICTIYNIENWDINIHYNTFGVIITGILSFLIASLIFDIFHRQKGKIPKIKEEIDYIEIKRNKLVILNIVSLLILFIYAIYFIKALGGVTALSNLNNAMAIYRSKTLFHHITLIPGWINFMTKICRAIAFIYSYILINNLIKSKNNNKKQQNILLYIVGIITYLPITIMSGGRYDLIVFIIYLIIIWSILYTIENQRRFQLKKIIKIGVIIIAILIAFSNFKWIVGRTSDSNTIEYITEYFGSSIAIFDMYMQDDYEKSEYFGQETFAGVRKLLYQVKLIDEQGINEKTTEFRTIYNGTVIGNVYTGFRKLYQDFGLFGVIVLQSLMAIIFNQLYFNCFYKKDNKKIKFTIILTGTLGFCLVLHSFSEAFYSTVISFNYISLFIIIISLIYYLQKSEKEAQK